MAFRRLVISHRGEITHAVRTRDGRQVDYIRLDDDEHDRRCAKCRYIGPFIDGGETCPNCALVQ